ncbi:C4-dicarboxylate transport mae1 [Fusarium mundagurra]|uniref:C4-dicarboxylate transport mae1 n=1 Tax=Fusarium mundagurra TaxID=1567541 RepID=A0A8H5Z6Q3_9HYPO|nr:C4-dicarboxylate transport mae1 [Fusarium mundagurra]
MGYRPISLSSCGPPHDARYSAIWVYEPLGPDLQMIHDVPKPVFDSWVEKLRKRKYVLTHVTVTGAEEEAIFAGVMEEDRKPNKTVWTLDCGIKNWEPFLTRTESGLKMKTQGFSSYGTPDNRTYCILRHENRGNENVALYADLKEEDFQQVFTGEITKPFWRPKKLFMSNDLEIAGLFTDTSVGDWYSDTHLNETALEATIKEQTSKGLTLTGIQGGVREGEEFYNVIFQELLEPKTRHWHATGKETEFLRMHKSLDSIMEKFMKTNGVRQAQVAIASRGVIMAERAYTWAEDDREIVATNDTFLLASVSKMFTTAAINHLINRGKLSLRTKVYKRLGYFDAKDERAKNITVKNLLEHKGGYDRREAGEDISVDFNKVTMSLLTKGNRTATTRDVIEYMLAQPLQFTPGEKKSYSNYGYMLLGYLVSNVTGMPYMDFLEKNIFRGLDVELYKTSPSEHRHDRIIQESRLTGLDTLRPMSNRSVAAVYGGYGAIMEECSAAFSLKASASTIAKFSGFHVGIQISYGVAAINDLSSYKLNLFQLNPPPSFIFLGSSLCVGLGMSFSADGDGRLDLKRRVQDMDNDNWKEGHTRVAGQKRFKSTANIRIAERLKHITWAWFTFVMSTGGIALLLHSTPHQFRGLQVIGKIYFILTLVLFVTIVSGLVFRFMKTPYALRNSLMHPTESLFFPCSLLSLATIIANATVYGIPAAGPWLATALRVCFWLYAGLSIFSAIVQFYVLFTGAHLPIHSMTPAWILPVFPAMLTGTLASALMSSQSPEHRMSMLVAGLAFQGLGWTVSLFMYPLYLGRLMQDGLPAPAMRPGMFIAVGPAGYTAVAIIGMSRSLPEGYGYFATYPMANEILRVLALWTGVWIWCVGFWFLGFSLFAVLASALRWKLKFSMSWWAFVFPNIGFTLATAYIGEELQSEGIKWVSSAMTILLVIMWFVVLYGMISAVIRRKLLWPGRDGDES